MFFRPTDTTDRLLRSACVPAATPHQPLTQSVRRWVPHAKRQPTVWPLLLLVGARRQRRLEEGGARANEKKSERCDDGAGWKAADFLSPLTLAGPCRPYNTSHARLTRPTTHPHATQGPARERGGLGTPAARRACPQGETGYVRPAGSIFTVIPLLGSSIKCHRP